MVSGQPHFLLFSGTEPSEKRSRERWHFLLEGLDGDTVLDASDVEPGVTGERLELVALIRGLEALDQPSRVTLITTSRHITYGLRHGLEEWRAHHWCWERDGRWVPVKNADLWRRVDRALHFHHVVCRRLRWESAPEPAASDRSRESRHHHWLDRWRLNCQQWSATVLRSWKVPDSGGQLVRA